MNHIEFLDHRQFFSAKSERETRSDLGKLFTLDKSERFLDEGMEDLLVQRGFLEFERASYVFSKVCFQKALKTNVENDLAWMGLSLLNRENGDMDLAVATLKKTLDLNIHNKEALVFLVKWSQELREASEAIKYLQKYLAKNWDDVEVSLLLADMFCRTRNLPFARIELERVIALDPKNESVEPLLEKCLERQ